jgi:ABC-type phosphate transport system substrate-binding protein
MQHRMAKVSLAGALATATAFAVAATPAFADYAPNSHDVVGVGSDTVQYAGDFVADGSYVGSAGYNSALNKYKIINFDATPDANARLAYGNGGVGGTNACAPGTGSTQGTGADTVNHTDTPCTLNPTLVLRAGTKPVIRPNGSGDGAKALAGDTAAGRNWLTYSRASSNQDTTLPSSSFNVAKLGTDNLQLLTATTTNAIPLNRAQLGQIYTCNITNWQQLDNTSDSTATIHYYTSADVTGGFTPGPNDVQLQNATIYPIVPQVGSGTRSSFLGDIGGVTPGTCTHVGEENDPTAIAGAGTQSVNAIEPMSGGRLNLFQGVNGTGGGATVPAGSNGKGGYFTDPSCKEQANGSVVGTGDCTSGTTSSITGAPLAPAVTMVTSGTPSTCYTPTGSTTPTCSSTDLNAYLDNRNLYIYFRKADVDSTTAWQPGTLPNAVRVLFYNPCDPNTSNNGQPGVDNSTTGAPDGHGFTSTDCVTVGTTTYGPGGPPYFAKTAGLADIAAAGINASYGVSTTGTGGTFS